MKRRVLAAFLAMMLTCGVAFPGNTVYAAEVTETTAESDAAVEETAVQTTDAEEMCIRDKSRSQPVFPGMQSISGAGKRGNIAADFRKLSWV